MADTEAGSCEQPCSHMVAWREKPDMLQLRVSPARGIAEHMQEGRGGRAGTGARPGGWGGGGAAMRTSLLGCTCDRSATPGGPPCNGSQGCD